MVLGIGFCLIILALAAKPTTAATASSFPRNLKLGDYGEDVLLLQKTLNKELRPGIAATGPGSPGNETMFFGTRTRDAVARFQEKYTAEVLSPVGLVRGTGFVGSLTRAKMLALLAKTAPAQVTATIPSSAPTAPASAQQPSNPNLVNLDIFIEGMAKIQRGNGVEESKIEEIKNYIRTTALTSGDFKQEFARRDAEAATKKKLQSNKSWRDILIASFKKVDPFIKTANAQGPAFGGPILYYWPCSCPATTAVIYIGPPSVVEALDYIYGTQAFLSYNLPYARFVLGLYEPGIGGACWNAGNPCTPLYSEGTVTEVVGSSA